MTTYTGTSTVMQSGVSSSSGTVKDAMQATATGVARGLSASAVSNDAIFASCSSATHSGVNGTSTGAGCGVTGSSNTTTGGCAGVVGVNTAGGTGVLGTTSSSTVSGSTAGVWGRNTSNGVGVYGNANGSGVGVYGIDQNGVVGVGNAGTGVTGKGLNGGIGVFAYSDTGYSIWADNGDVHVSHNVNIVGNLTAGTKDFRIEHPLDSNKWLRHSCLESPARKNVYDGKVVTDANGEAHVQMPSYFEALNEDFCYQLTALGTSAPSLHVKQEVSKNVFVIAGANPGQRVSWQVTGTRKDAAAKANPLVVESSK